MKRNLNLYFYDILEVTKVIENSIKNKTKKDFAENRDLLDATIRRILVIGEAVLGRKISFMKVYGGRDDSPEENSRAGVIRHDGEISRYNSIITLGGSYQPVGISENYKGVWGLTSQ